MSTAPFGIWKSPITADAIVSNAIKIDSVLVDPVTSVVYHIEQRSTGANALVNTINGSDVAADGFNVRTGVEEYGGGAAIAYGGIVYFSNIIDGRVYSVKEGQKPEAVTPESNVYRFSDFTIYPQNPTLLVSIFEDHTNDTPQTVLTSLCVIDTVNKTVSELKGTSKADFFAAPRFNPNGKMLVWQQWLHPDMPWEGAELYVAEVKLKESGGIVTELSVVNAKHFAGKKADISAAYPAWANDSTVVFTSDESGYQNPWTYSVESQSATPVFSKSVAEDFSGPAWTLGGSPFAVLDSSGDTAVFAAFRGGRNVLYLVNLRGGDHPHHQIDPCPFASITDLRSVAHGSGSSREFIFAMSKSDGPGGIVRCALSSSTVPFDVTYTVIKSTSDENAPTAQFPPGIISVPKPRTIMIEGNPLHLVTYSPRNPDYTGSSIVGEKPPCVINVHGGPTGMTSQALSWTTQYFTSRGWTWLDVNYGGSSNYGRAYTALLAGKWGVKDADDCLEAAKALSSEIDTSRVVIRGGSAGGYTVLSSLSFGKGNTFYAAATSSYGISNLRTLTQFTHKFELKYMDKLLGGTIEDIPDVHDKERSPIYNADKIEMPLLILQGSEDKVVPPDQAEAIVKSIENRGGKVKYVLFEGEGHGWRKAENRKKALETEIAWYEEALRLCPA